MNTSIRKKLSANDVGETGAHQAGILVPKAREILSFFPSLDAKEKNPRLMMVVREQADHTRWEFNFIYYNNRLFGGTRNEYRLTGMTRYLRSVGAKTGDELVFSRDSNASILINCLRGSSQAALLNESGALVLTGGWRIIQS